MAKNTLKDRPRYKSIYQSELAEEITGKNWKTIYRYMKRHDITLAETIRRLIIA